MHKFYVGIDLHSNNSYMAIINENDLRIYQKRLPNMPDVLLAELEPFRDKVCGIVVESTFNWYWLVDLLMENGYTVHLANPAGIQKYKGLKHLNDRHDAFWLAHLLRLGILPSGYIYPKESRPIRDLLRKRCHLVRLRTSLINSLQSILRRNCACKLNVNKIKQTTTNHIAPLLSGQQDLELCGAVSKQSIDHLTRQIQKIEAAVLDKVEDKHAVQTLQTMPGIGKVLSLTIMLETGNIERFENVGNFSSYCRKVPSNWTSNDKKKGSGNRKNGNKYLAWAFSEAAELARRFDDQAKRFYNRKAMRTNFMVAHSALAHKLARAAYYIMRDGVEFDHRKIFS
jgi:transposase